MTRIIIINVRAYSLRRMFQSQLKAVGNVTRSKLFLLFVIFVLTGYIGFHLTGSGPQLNIVNPTVFSPPPVRLRNLRNKELLSEELLIPKQTLNVNVSSEIQNKSILTISTCKKKFDVSFLKVHKAGSTTIMNIFLRFAISNNLNIVLPPKSTGFGFNYLGYGKTVSKDRIVPLPNNESYNILCNHVVYNRDAFRSIMPDDTTYVGILREPKSHFKSAASYYGFYNNLKNYVKEHRKHLSSPLISEFLKNPGGFPVSTYFVYNRMSFDFGVPKDQFHNESFVDEYIDELDGDYGLVMIMERFSESLVLLKRLLCWDTNDILYVPLNARRGTTEFSLTDTDTKILEKWNGADYKLYRHYNTIFDKRIEDAGPDFQEEVESFKNIQETVSKYCRSRQSSDSDLKIPETKWDDSFVVTQADCRLMTSSELPMMVTLINEAWARYKNGERR